MPIPGTGRPELAQEHTGRVEHLHAIVAVVGYDDVVARRIDRDAARLVELAGPVALRTELKHVTERAVEYLDAIVPGIGHE